MSDHDAAFPCAHSEQWHNNQNGAPYQTGMSLRDWFAGQVAPVLAAELYRQSHTNCVQFDSIYDIAASSSYEFADAMLKARAHPNADTMPGGENE